MALANLNSNGTAAAAAAILDSDTESDSDSEGWIALEDLPLYTTSNGATQFLDDEVENGGIDLEHRIPSNENGAPQVPPPLTQIETAETPWRADFDDLKPPIEDTAVSFDLTSDQLDAVKERMQNISLEYKPEWAAVVDDWQEQLQSRLHGRREGDRE